MTCKTGGQKVINYQTGILDAIDQIYEYYKEADFIDCRINAFPFNTEYSIDLDIRNKISADFFMIDLDLKDFELDKVRLDRLTKKDYNKNISNFSL